MIAIRIFIWYTFFGVLTSAINHYGYWLALKKKEERVMKDFMSGQPGLLEYAESRINNGPGLGQVLHEIVVWPRSWICAIAAIIIMLNERKSS